MDVAGWVTKILGMVWEGGTAVHTFFSSPQVEIIPSGSVFGRLEGGQLALLLKVRFRNESERPVLVRSLRVQFGGAWHEPQDSAPAHLALNFSNGRRIIGARPGDFMTVAPRIPGVEVVERFAFYCLSEPGEQFPKSLPLTVEAVFSRGKTRRVAVTLRAPS
jgi:hypothetical protein